MQKPGKRKSRGFGKRSFRRRPLQKSEFLFFLENVLGKPESPHEAKKAKAFVSRFLEDLDNHQTSLARRRKLWNRISPFYRQILLPERIDQELAIIKRHVVLNKSDSIASLCSGPAVMEAFIAKNLVPTGKVTCIDFSSKMTRIARAVRDKAGAKNMRVIAGSAAKTKLPASSQDKVIISQTDLVLTRQWELVLKEVFRILKKSPSARFILSFALDDRKKLPKIYSPLLENGLLAKSLIKYASSSKWEAFLLISGIQPKFWASARSSL